MAKKRPTGSQGTTAPISGHRLFPAVIALWGAALFGLVSALVPTATIERLISASGIAALIPAASQPLTFEIHMAIALIAAVIGGWLGLVAARRLAVAQYNALPTSSNRMARITRQTPVAPVDKLSGGEFGDLAAGGAANLAFASPDEPYARARPQFNLSSDPISIWGDAPPAAVPGTYGPELPELLLSEELEAAEEPQWEDLTGPLEAEENFFESHIDWPSDQADAYQAVPDESGDAWPDAASPEAAPLDSAPQFPEPDLFSLTASHFEPEMAEPEMAEPDEETDDASTAPGAWEAQADWGTEPATGLAPEDEAEPYAPLLPPYEGNLDQAFGPVEETRSFEAEEDGSPLPSDDREIGPYAAEAAWPSPSPSISDHHEHLGEPEGEGEIWPASQSGDTAGAWDDASPFAASDDVEDEYENEDEDEEAASILDTTLGAFRDYARDYTGGDDGEEEEEEEEEEDDTTSSFGSLLGMTVRRRAADEPIELVGFDGEPVELSDCEIEIPDELEDEEEYASPLLVRRRTAGR